MSTTPHPDARATDGAVLRVVLAAGGTGGHLMPALATAEALERRAQCEFLVVGSPRAGERALRGLVPYPVVEVRARTLAGRGLLRKLVSLLSLPLAVATALRHLLHFNPHVVIATGGYVCGPTGIAAWLARIPLLLLEQNATPGITTRGLRIFARAIAVSFPETAQQLGRKAVVTGNPIRATLPVAADRQSTLPSRTARSGQCLLILGGSQGAHGLNTMIELAIPLLAGADIGLTVTHQTGKLDVEKLRSAYSEYGIPATVTPFIDNIGEAYACCDLVCARAGATTVAELSYCGLPSILVPFPGAAAQHQHDNARTLERAGAALLVEEAANGKPLADAVVSLVSDPDRLAAMATAAAGCGRDDAAAAVADLALSLTPHPGTSQPAAGGSPSDPAHRGAPGVMRTMETA